MRLKAMGKIIQGVATSGQPTAANLHGTRSTPVPTPIPKKSGERLYVKHASAGMGGTQGGNSPTLTYQFQPILWAQTMWTISS